MSATAVIGMQWGDEGKGKVIDLLAERATHIVRAQGGHNAGHTIVVRGREYRFHLIPSGILYPHTQCYIGGGTVLDPHALLKEIEGLGMDVRGRLWISPYAHLIFPYHVVLDHLSEKAKGHRAVGTTGKGIGPCYTDKAQRRGIRLADLLSSGFADRLAHVLEEKNRELGALYGLQPFELAPILAAYRRFGEQITPYVAPVEEIIADALERKEPILFEGAQGALLDLTFGTYPFVTSSCTLAGGIAAGSGIGPNQIDHVMGVTKVYTTRVGNGPFPTEFSLEEQPAFPDHTVAREIGVTTGRKRRIGWFDAVLMRRTVCLNGIDSLALMKLDILDTLPELQICTAYEVQGHRTERFPASLDALMEATPIYETHPGWLTSTRDATSFAELPPAAQRYVSRIEELMRVPAQLISVGPGRHETLWKEAQGIVV